MNDVGFSILKRIIKRNSENERVKNLNNVTIAGLLDYELFCIATVNGPGPLPLIIHFFNVSIII